MLKTILRKFRPQISNAASSSAGSLSSAFGLPEQLQAKNHLGLVQDGTNLYSAHLQISLSKISINLLATLPVSEAAPLAILQNHLPASNLQKACIAVAFPSLKTLSRAIEMHQVPSNEFEAVLRFQMEPQLPYSIEEAILASCVIDKSGPIQYSQVYCVQKEEMKKLLDGLQELSLDPEIVAPKIMALTLFTEIMLPPEEVRILIDIAGDETSCILFCNSKPVALRSLAMSIQTQDDDENHLQKYAREVSRILLSFEQFVPDLSLVPITFTGPGERDPLILSILAKLLGHKNEQPTVKPAFLFLHDAISMEECAAYATPIGLALLESPFQKINRKFFLNLRQHEFAYSHKWRRWKKDLKLYFAFMSLAALVCFQLGKLSHSEPERFVKEHYASFVAQLGKTPEEIEKLYLASTGGDQEPFETLSSSQIGERLMLIEHNAQNSGELFALHPDVPRVADTLAWLRRIKEASEMKLDTFSYQLVKRPEKEKTKERYQVRVSLAFTMPSPEAAKELREALLKPNFYIDPSHELAWSVEKGRYKASFTLKDKTEYPL